MRLSIQWTNRTSEWIDSEANASACMEKSISYVKMDCTNGTPIKLGNLYAGAATCIDNSYFHFHSSHEQHTRFEPNDIVGFLILYFFPSLLSSLNVTQSISKLPIRSWEKREITNFFVNSLHMNAYGMSSWMDDVRNVLTRNWKLVEMAMDDARNSFDTSQKKHFW